jgi:hypothetical protein
MAEETLDGAENFLGQNSELDQFMAQSDFLNPARIEQPIDATLKWQDTFINPTNFIKDSSAGISPNLPPSQARRLDQQDTFAAMIAKQQQELNSVTDVGTYAEPYAYDAGPSGTFRARYKAYGQDTFNKLGFNPLIDNETWYNQNTTFGDDLKRWAVHSAWPMFTKGLIDPIKSYASILSGDGLFAADPEGARDYQYYNALAQSTKGGLGGFTVNLLNSASYSMGILTEGAIEGSLIGFLYGGPAGAAKGGMSVLQRLSNLPKGLANLAKGTSKMLDDVNSYTNINKAKDYWKQAGVNFGNFINPLQNTTTALKNVDNLTNVARSSATAGAFWHDVMAMNLALSEGKLEGGFTRNETYDKIYNEWLADPKNKGKKPTVEEQEAMMKEASLASWWNTHNNTALIYLTNKLVFPSITRASFLKGAPKFAFGKTVTNVGKEYQILFEPGKKLAEGQFVKQKINLVNALKSLGKPTTYGKVGLNYFKANVMEGFQEVAQDVLQEATQEYYTQSFFDKDARNFRYASGLVSNAIAKQWSAQGFETFMSGFLMGTILQAPGKIKNYASIGYNDYFKNDAKYQDYIKNRTQMADDIVNELNTLYKNANYFFDPRISNYAQLSLAHKVIDNPEEHTTKEIKDTEFAAFQSALYSSLERGTFDLFLNHYKQYQQASATDLEEAWNLKPGEGEKALERFGKSLDEAEKIAFRYNKAKDAMKDYRLDLNDYEKDTEEYRMAQVYNKAFNLALNNYVFLHDSYDHNLERINKLNQKLTSIVSLGQTPITNITALTDPAQLKREIEMIKTEVETLESVTTQEAIAEVTKKRELLELYTRYNQNLEKIYGLFVNKELLNKKIEDLVKSTDEQTYDEEVRLDVYRSIVNEFESGLTETDENFKETFYDLIVGLGETNEDRRKIQDAIDKEGGKDTLYDDLLDNLLLENEKSVLNRYVHILASPDGFYEHVIRNFKFMKDLYNNREEIIQDIVNQEITAIERNSLLNTLAEQEIFLDLEEFTKWIEDHNYRPEYFIDTRNNRMITEDSLIYEDYIDILRRAAQLDAEKPAGEKISLREKLDKRIAELTEERDNLIEKERLKYYKDFEDKYGMTPDQYESQESQRIAGETLTEEKKKELEADKKKLEDALKTLQESENFVEVAAAVEVVAADIMPKDNINPPTWLIERQNELVQELDTNPEKVKELRELEVRFAKIVNYEEKQNAILYTLAYIPWITNKISQIEQDLTKEPAAPEINVEETKEYLRFQEAVEAITLKYDQIIADVRAEFEEKGVNENTPIVYTTKTKFEDFNTQYQNEITELFDKYLIEVLGETIELKENNPIEYERLRKNWLESQTELINDFNERSKLAAEERAERLSKPPMLTFTPVQIGIDKSIHEISQIIKAFEKYLKDGEFPSSDGKKMIPLTRKNIEDINNDLEALRGYLKARIDAGAPRDEYEQMMQDTVDIIQDNIIDKQDELENIYDEDGNHIGRKFKDSDVVPERTSKIAEEVDNTINESEPYLYEALKDKVDKDTGEVLEKSPVETLYDLIFNDPEVPAEDKVDRFMAAFENKALVQVKGERRWFTYRYPEKLAAIRNSLETDGSYEALRNVLIREANRESSDAGNVVDDLIRIYLTPNPSTKSGFSEFTYDSELEIKGKMTKISDVMSRKAFDKLFAPVTLESSGGILTDFRLGILDGNYMILSENVKLFDRNLRDTGVTGELDLILVREDGTVAIVDIKTAGKGKWEKFGTSPERGYENSIRYRAQQSIYGYMFHNNTGITPDLKLMPFEVTLSQTKVGYIEDIDLALDQIKKANKTIEEKGIGTPHTINLHTFDLEYLPEIEDHGIVKTAPEKVIIRPKQETPKEEPGIPPTDPTKLTLEDNIDKMVMYKGRVGKLIQMADGSFAIEIPIAADLSTIQLTLSQLEGIRDSEDLINLRSEEELQELNENIDKLTKAIESQEGLVEVFPIEKLNVNIVNEKLTLADVGLQIVAPVESVGQVSVIEGEVVDASFSNESQTVASINGVRYDVNRDRTGSIVSLSYKSNDAEISKIDKEIGQKANQVGRLRERVKEEEDQFKRNRINDRISDLQAQIRSLSSRRAALYDSNKTQYLYGANANNYIFALNRLPNSFQKLTRRSNKLDEVRDLKEIDRLSLSTAISQAITEILAEEYPEELDQLFDGTFDYKFKAKRKINKWIDNSIEKLYQLGYTVLNRGDLTDDIQNQVNALLDLKNDIALIKLTRDKKIKNYAEVRKIFTEGQVQERTRVPKNERVTGKQSKGVSGQSKREQLKKIVKQSRQGLSVNLGGAPKTTKTEVDVHLENINNALADKLEEVYEAAVLNVLKSKNIPNKTEVVNELTKAKNDRFEMLATAVSLDTISKGEYLISKNPIFDNQENTIFEVVRINKQSVRLKNILSNEQITINEEDLMNNFEKTTEEATQPTPEVEVDVLDIEGSNESKSVVKDLANDAESINKFKENAEKSDVKSRFDKLNDNSKKC